MPINPKAKTRIEQRTIKAATKRYCFRFEVEFWDALEEIAAKRKISVGQIVEKVQAARGRRYLASSMRVFVLGEFRKPARKR